MELVLEAKGIGFTGRGKSRGLVLEEGEAKGGSCWRRVKPGGLVLQRVKRLH